MDAGELGILVVELLDDDDVRLGVVLALAVLAEEAARHVLHGALDAVVAGPGERLPQRRRELGHRREEAELVGVVLHRQVVPPLHPRRREGPDGVDDRRERRLVEGRQHRVGEDADPELAEVLEAADRLVERSWPLGDVVLGRRVVAVERDEELVDACVDDPLGEGSIGEETTVGLDADVLEALRVAGDVDVVEEALLERDLAAGEGHPSVALGPAVVGDRRLVELEGHALVVVHPLLDDAEAARAVTVEVDGDRQVLEARRLKAALVALHQRFP